MSMLYMVAWRLSALKMGLCSHRRDLSGRVTYIYTSDVVVYWFEKHADIVCACARRRLIVSFSPPPTLSTEISIFIYASLSQAKVLCNKRLEIVISMQSYE